jgi:putative transposase
MVAFLPLLCYTMCMKENLLHYRTSVCNINYHMVWSVKYRRKILNADIEAYLKKLVQQFPEIRSKLWKGELWNHSYYCETIGSVSEENIKRYIEHQSKSY